MDQTPSIGQESSRNAAKFAVKLCKQSAGFNRADPCHGAKARSRQNEWLTLNRAATASWSPTDLSMIGALAGAQPPGLQH